MPHHKYYVTPHSIVFNNSMNVLLCEGRVMKCIQFLDPITNINSSVYEPSFYVYQKMMVFSIVLCYFISTQCVIPHYRQILSLYRSDL